MKTRVLADYNLFRLRSRLDLNSSSLNSLNKSSYTTRTTRTTRVTRLTDLPPLPPRKSKGKKKQRSRSPAVERTKDWPPALPASIPETSKGRASEVSKPRVSQQRAGLRSPVAATSRVLAGISQNVKTNAVRRVVQGPTESFEVYSWSDDLHVPLPPPEPRRASKSKFVQTQRANVESLQMFIEDMRSNMLRMDDEKKQIKTDIRTCEVKLKELSKGMKQVIRKNKHRTAMLEVEQKTRLRVSKNPLVASVASLGDSYRFSVRSQRR